MRVTHAHGKVRDDITTVIAALGVSSDAAAAVANVNVDTTVAATVITAAAVDN